MNLFGNPNTPSDGGFLNQPTWAQTMVELNRRPDGSAGPPTVVCSSLDFLMRTQETILIHELMHVQGIGMRHGTSFLLVALQYQARLADIPADGSRIVDQQLADGTYAYGENGVNELARQNPQAAVENADTYAAYITGKFTPS